MSDDAQRAYSRRYEGRVDLDNPLDAHAEASRLAVVGALEKLALRTGDPEMASSLISGALLGLVQVTMCLSGASNQRDRMIVQGLSSLMPWAVDSARIGLGLPPLEDVQ